MLINCQQTHDALWHFTIYETHNLLYNFLACHVLPNDLILVAGSTFDPFEIALYNFETNRWTVLEQGVYHGRGASLITLGQRVFFLGGEDAEIIEEFDYNTNTWSVLNLKILLLKA